MLLLALACAPRAVPPAELDLAGVVLAPVEDPPVYAVRDAAIPLGRTVLHRAGGRLWAIAGEIGAQELVALDEDGAIRWRRPLQAEEFWRVSEDGQRVVRADFLGCIEQLDAATGARLHGFTWTIDPWAWDLSPDGEVVWTLHDDGLVGWRIAEDDERLATWPLTENERSGDLFVAPGGAVAWITSEGAITARSLADGALLGRAALREHVICDVADGRVWVEPRWGDGAPFPLDGRTLARSGPPDPKRCEGYGGTATRALVPRMYGLALEDRAGWAASLGYGIDDALLDADGGGW